MKENTITNNFGSCLTLFISIMHFQNIDDMRNGRRTKVPLFDLETGARSGFKELEVSEDCGVVCYCIHLLYFSLTLNIYKRLGKLMLSI